MGDECEAKSVPQLQICGIVDGQTMLGGQLQADRPDIAEGGGIGFNWECFEILEARRDQLQRYALPPHRHYREIAYFKPPVSRRYALSARQLIWQKRQKVFSFIG